MSITSQIRPAQQVSDTDWNAYHCLRAKQSNFASPFFDPSFAQLINDLRQDVTIATLEDDNGLLAFWPMHLGIGQTARACGGPFFDYNGPIVRQHAKINAIQMLETAGIAEYKTSGMMVCDQVKAGPILLCSSQRTDLTAGWSDFLTAQSACHPKFFKNMRRLNRKLEKDFSEVTFQFDNRNRADFDQLIQLKRRQFAQTGRHDVLAPKWVSKMLNALWNGYCAHTKTNFSTLHVDGKMMAAELNLRSGDLLHGWLVAYDPEFSKYSPGNLLLHKMLETMPEQGLVTYDAGIGSEHYKKYFSNQQIPVGSGVLRTNENQFNPASLLSRSLEYLETNMPGGQASTLQRIHRRSDQILSTETQWEKRALGYAKAILPLSLGKLGQ